MKSKPCRAGIAFFVFLVLCTIIVLLLKTCSHSSFNDKNAASITERQQIASSAAKIPLPSQDSSLDIDTSDPKQGIASGKDPQLIKKDTDSLNHRKMLSTLSKRYGKGTSLTYSRGMHALGKDIIEEDDSNPNLELISSENTANTGTNNPAENTTTPNQESQQEADDADFLQEGSKLIALTEQGRRKVQSTGTIAIPKDAEELAANLFSSSGLNSIILPPGLKTIGKDAFYNNEITELALPESLTKVEAGALDGNNLTEIHVPNNNLELPGIYYNKRYVNILTNNNENTPLKDKLSTDPNFTPRSERTDKPYGSLVNCANTHVRYLEADGNTLYAEQSWVARKLEERTSDNIEAYYRIGDTLPIKPRISGYAHQLPRLRTLEAHTQEDFIYTKEVQADERQLAPIFVGLKDKIIYLDSAGSESFNPLKGVRAYDHEGTDISSAIHLTNEGDLKLGSEGVYELQYEVSDKNGRQSKAKALVHVQRSDAWYPNDFLYDEDIVTGLSDFGSSKFHDVLTRPEQKIIKLPSTTPDGKPVHGIGSAAFAELRVRKVVIPQGYTHIADYAFNSTLLESLELPDSVVEVGRKAFATCEISELKLGSSLKTIKERAFANNNLKEIHLPSQLEYIGNSAFTDNYHADKDDQGTTNKSLTIPSSVRSIGAEAFLHCSLTSLEIEEGLIEIQDSAFGRNLLSRVTLPNSLTKLHPASFKLNSPGKSSLDSMPVLLFTKDGTNPHNFASNNFQLINWDPDIQARNWSDEDFSFDERGGLTLSERGKITALFNHDLVVPARIHNREVNSIGAHAFMSKKFKTISLPDTVQKIGDAAFYLNELHELTLPASLITIGEAAFADNPLDKLTINDKLQSIGKSAFWHSALHEVQLNQTIQFIGAMAFERSDKTKVILHIESTPQTQDFINHYKASEEFELRTDTTSQVQLLNPLTEHGVKAGDRLDFKFALAPSEKPLVKLNGKPQAGISFYSGTDRVFVRDYLNDLISDRLQSFEFIFGSVHHTLQVPIFKPDTIVLAQPEAQLSLSSDGLHIPLMSSGQLPLKNLQVYRPGSLAQQGSSEAQFDETKRELILSRAYVERYATDNARALEILVEGDYHSRTPLRINLQSNSTNVEAQGTELSFKGAPEDDGFTLHYSSHALKDNLFSLLKQAYESNTMELSVGRYRLDRSDDPDFLEDAYHISFSPSTKSLELYLPSNSSYQFEQLVIRASGKRLVFDIERDFSLSPL